MTNEQKKYLKELIEVNQSAGTLIPHNIDILCSMLTTSLYDLNADIADLEAAKSFISILKKLTETNDGNLIIYRGSHIGKRPHQHYKYKICLVQDENHDSFLRDYSSTTAETYMVLHLFAEGYGDFAILYGTIIFTPKSLLHLYLLGKEKDKS